MPGLEAASFSKGWPQGTGLFPREILTKGRVMWNEVL